MSTSTNAIELHNMAERYGWHMQWNEAEIKDANGRVTSWSATLQVEPLRGRVFGGESSKKGKARDVAASQALQALRSLGYE